MIFTLVSCLSEDSLPLHPHKNVTQHAKHAFASRRSEKKAAASMAGKRSDIVLESNKRMEKEKKTRPPPFRLEDENVVYSCFSA
ncbi:hypothetical protein QYF36_002081 [Acer negundo]|nr:hypothetical protein QYF36_002081 [Acer negundo]